MTESELKERSRSQSAEIKKLRKRIKELTHSRDVWKQKSMDKGELIAILNKKLETLKKNIERIMYL